MWFESLTGFSEQTPDQVRANLIQVKNTITSKVNGRTMECGYLEVPTLSELRTRVKEVTLPRGRLSIREVVADVQELHTDVQNAGAFFQVASQFNLLEMISPSVSPEHGIGIYENDRTQGPACAIAAGAGTIYRNYYAQVNGKIGQSESNQIDCLHDLGLALGNANNRLWVMQNGYALASREGLYEIASRLGGMSETERDALRECLRIGIQWDTQVTLGNCEHRVTQVYCSALPVAYSKQPQQLWSEFARLVLEASYESALSAAVLNRVKTGNNRVYLTLLGGGAFGNEMDWIFAAIKRALGLYADLDLDVAIVSYGRSNARVQAFVDAQSYGERAT